MSSLADIVRDQTLDDDERATRIARHLWEQPGRGAEEAVAFLREATSAEEAGDVANYLAALPGFAVEKLELLEVALDERPQLIAALSPLTGGIPPDRAQPLMERAHADPDAFDIALELGLFFSARLGEYRDRVDDDVVRRALLPGADDAFVGGLADAYRDDPDPETLGELAVVRTDKARDALISLQNEIQNADEEQFALLLELAGVDPDTRRALFYPPTFRGYAVARDESPHAMGDGFSRPVPACPICEEPATRVLTLSAADTPFDLATDPSFFWFSCDHDALEFLYWDPSAPEGLMTPMTEEAPSEPLVPDAPSLLCVDHPNQHGYGVEVVAGSGLHQVGGYVPWLEHDRHPACPRCSRSMPFIASVDSGLTPLGPMRFSGTLFGFWCDDCKISCTTRQADELE